MIIKNNQISRRRKSIDFLSLKYLLKLNNTKIKMPGTKKITINSPIETPDCIIVLDQQLPKITNVVHGLKEGGIAVLNDIELPEKVDLGVKLSKIATVDATGVSNELFGPRSIPITNTTMLAAFCKATGWVKLETLFEPIKERFGGRISEANIKAANLGYERVKVKEF